MTSEDTERTLDAAFERLLLDSARHDAPPDGAQREAWVRLAAVAGSAVAGAGVGLDGSALARAVRRAGARWFAIGALSGGALTAGWMVATRAPVTLSTAPSATHTSATRVASSSVPEPESAPPSSPDSAPARAPATPELSSRPSKRPLRSTGATSSSGSSARVTRSASTLALEIEALDAVQAALTRRDFARAFELAERYGKEFPAGQLRAEAEALGIEALAGQGKQAEARRRALSFLRRYPNDPHRARIEAVSESSLASE